MKIDEFKLMSTISAKHTRARSYYSTS